MNSSSNHLTPRQKAREIAFQFLYRYDALKDPVIDTSEIEVEFSRHLSHFGGNELSSEFALRIILTTLREIRRIDQKIEECAQNWKFDRIAAVDKAFLRIGTAELLFFKDVPAKVTLNEIIELSKLFGEKDTPVFLNGILDPISRDPLAMAGKVPSDS
jgi:transcription antitermination factor NusB